MADFGDPYAAMNTNPYLMPQAPAPDWKQVLGNALLGVGAGISSADASGAGWGAGIGPGLMYGTQLMARQQQQAEQQAMKRWQMGLMAQQYKDKQEERELKRRQLALGADAYVPSLQAPPPSPQMMSGVTDPAANAISGIESGGRYDAVGPVANSKGQRAYGKYQVMDFNIPTWTAEVLGKSMTPQEFLANPQAQEAVFKTKFGQFRQQYGSDQDAASVWFSGRPLAGNTAGPDVNGTTVAGYVNKFNRGLYGGQGNTTDVQTAQAGGPRVVPQGDAIAGQGDAPPRVTADAPPTLTLPQRPTLDAATAQRLRTLHFADPARAASEYKQILETQQQEAKAKYDQKYEAWKHKRGQSEKDAWEPLNEKNAQMILGPAYDGKAYQRNKVTGEIKPVAGAQTTVNIDNKTEAEFGKEMGKMDAQRFGKIIEAEGTMNDMASKIGFAMDQFRKTYTGPGAEAANQLNRILGAAGFEEAGKKASAADAAQAVISQMKPHMRASGSGASSDKDMDMFAKALPSLMNLPDGNERIAAFFQKMADRATRIRELAQEHSEGGKVPLTRTSFDTEVKKLGPLFNEDERKLLEGASKAPPKTDRPPISSFGREVPAPTMTPSQRPPLSSFGRGG